MWAVKRRYVITYAGPAREHWETLDTFGSEAFAKRMCGAYKKAHPEATLAVVKVAA